MWRYRFGVYSMELKYNRGGMTYTVSLHTTPITAKHATITRNHKTYYVAIGEVDHFLATHLRIKINGVTYAILKKPRDGAIDTEFAHWN
jgi:hypothetical protein